MWQWGGEAVRRVLGPEGRRVPLAVRVVVALINLAWGGQREGLHVDLRSRPPAVVVDDDLSNYKWKCLTL